MVQRRPHLGQITQPNVAHQSQKSITSKKQRIILKTRRIKVTTLTRRPRTSPLLLFLNTPIPKSPIQQLSIQIKALRHRAPNPRLQLLCLGHLRRSKILTKGHRYGPVSPGPGETRSKRDIIPQKRHSYQ